MNEKKDGQTIPGLSWEDVIWVKNGSRTYGQFLDMADKRRRGICPFCPEHFDGEKNRITKSVGEGESVWHLWRNPYPLDHTKHHFIIAPLRHITHLRSMTTEDWRNWSCLVNLVLAETEGETGVPGGCVATRFGDPLYHAGSLPHLHTNIIVPDGSGAVQVTLAKSREKEQDAMTRVLFFHDLMKKGVSVEEAPERAKEILSEEDYERIKNRLR